MNTKKKVNIFDKLDRSEQNQNDFQPTMIHGPHINSAILDQIARSDPRKDRQKINDQNGQNRTHLRTQPNQSNNQTLEQIRIEMNKKLLNSLLLDKIQRNMPTEKQCDQMTSSQKQEVTLRVFTEQSNKLKLNTLNNFRGLNQYFRNPAQFIDYEQVLKKVGHLQNKHLIPFIEKTGDDGKASLSIYTSKELMECLIYWQMQAKEVKSELYALRIENNQLMIENQHKEQELKRVGQKFYSREEKVRQSCSQSDLSPSKYKPKNSINEQLERLKQQREQEYVMIHLNIKRHKTQIQLNNERQSLHQRELDDITDKKKRCKMMLTEMNSKPATKNFSKKDQQFL